MKTLKNGYEITDPKGEKVFFIFNEKEQTWSMEENGICKEVIKFNEDGTICLVFNGEIYNYRELREELEQRMDLGFRI